MEQEAQRFKIHSRTIKIIGNTLMKEANTVMELLRIITIAPTKKKEGKNNKVETDDG